MIAYLCKKLGYHAICYTAALDNPDGDDPHDLIAGIEVAKRYGFEHKVVSASPEDVPLVAKKIAEVYDVDLDYVSKVTDMGGMFSGCKKFNQDISSVILFR